MKEKGGQNPNSFFSGGAWKAKFRPRRLKISAGEKRKDKINAPGRDWLDTQRAGQNQVLLAVLGNTDYYYDFCIKKCGFQYVLSDGLSRI